MWGRGACLGKVSVCTSPHAPTVTEHTRTPSVCEVLGFLLEAPSGGASSATVQPRACSLRASGGRAAGWGAIEGFEES